MNRAIPNPELDDILAECLDDVLHERQTVAQCLEHYPEYADELGPILGVGLLTSRLRSPEMAADAVNSLEVRLREQMAVLPKPEPARAGFFRLPLALSRLTAVIAIALMLAFGSGAGLVAASANSLPGDPLYAIKRLWEAIILALSPLTGQMDDLWLHLAETRLAETLELADQGQLNQQILIDLYTATAHALRYADAQSQRALLNHLNQTRVALAQIQPSAQIALVYQDVLNLTVARVNQGMLQPPDSLTPPSLMTLTPAAIPMATATATLTPTLTLTALPSLAPSVTSTNTLTATASFTPTPRIPPTPTKTPTLTPSPTFTLTWTPSPTATWTPLPLPWQALTGTAVPLPTLPPDNGGQPTPVIIPTLSIRERETQQSVYLTQTAGPPLVTPTSQP